MVEPLEPTDEELMHRFQQGDEQAFNTLFDRHSRGVRLFLQRMVSEPALADDVLQTTFLSMVKARARFEPDALFAPWLYSIAANGARDALRRRRRRDHAMAASRDVFADSVAPAPTSDPGLARRIQSAFDALPEQQREAVILHKVQGQSFDQIARSLNISLTAARIRAHRGYEKLRALLKDLEGSA